MHGDKDRDFRKGTDKLRRRGRSIKVTANPDFHVPLDSLPIASICHFLVCNSELVVVCWDFFVFIFGRGGRAVSDSAN